MPNQWGQVPPRLPSSSSLLLLLASSPHRLLSSLLPPPSQRVNGMKNFNGSMYFVTSCKNPITDDLYRGLIPDEAEAEYARVHKFTVPNEVSGRARLQPGLSSTAFDFELTETGISIKQDGLTIASRSLASPMHLADGALTVRSCEGIYGPCAKGIKVTASQK